MNVRERVGVMLKVTVKKRVKVRMRVRVRLSAMIRIRVWISWWQGESKGNGDGKDYSDVDGKGDSAWADKG